MKNAIDPNVLVKEFFGFDLALVSSTPVGVVEREKMKVYAQSNEVERAGLYAIEVSENERLKRDICRYVQETISLAKTLSMTEHAPLALKRAVYEFFKDFVGFTQNTAKSFGAHFNKSLASILEIPGAVTERGKYMHLAEKTMGRIDKRARTEFFDKLRRNSSLHAVFEERVQKYCEVVWFMVMQEYGTLNNDSAIMTAIRTEQVETRSLVTLFISEECEIGRGIAEKTQTLYEQYEHWCEANGYSMLGKDNFTKELIRLIPGVSITVQRNSKMNFWNGIRIKKKAS
ncbi:primase-like DNA-binding domain-containing protein [Brevibacillus brevis]|uniref:primase-like DNA-binding domain-containing protein n=1 Tax=Brevibacillus brevis TaxID=1393 RepID=UPI00165DBEFC|nr:primase-like DNA-binding domain-containing protein [Brevibacillus brevis]